jgi:ring-1,2-phenylacetyl-CoA epoxidase subunit PaaD
MSVIPVVSAEFNERLLFRKLSANQAIWALLDQVKDPEIPVISIWDLGVLQDVRTEGSKVYVVITPTYSGCPAMREIEQDIHSVLKQAAYPNVEVISRLAPAWTTDWMSPAGRERLREYGIAPPQQVAGRKPQCPQCGSSETLLISEFGSTSCKALFKCNECLEPFDYFKCI